MPTQALVGLVWAASWLAVPFAGGLSSGASATLVLCLVLAVFGIGECFHGAVQAPLVSDLARPELIGRYMAVSALSWNVAFFLGPALAGAALDAAPQLLWPAAAGVLVLCAGAALVVERSLPRAVRRTPTA